VDEIEPEEPGEDAGESVDVSAEPMGFFAALRALLLALLANVVKLDYTILPQKRCKVNGHTGKNMELA